MNTLKQERRSFLFGLGSLGFSQVLLQGVSRAQAAAPEGYVLGAAGVASRFGRDHYW